jgi:bacterioferritin-associated ferredoxin
MIGKDLDGTGLLHPKTTINLRNQCPLCKKSGQPVHNLTVRNLVQEEYIPNIGNHDFHLCMSQDCDIAYYDEHSNISFTKAQLKVTLWYKTDAVPKYACYCAKVTQEEVIDAIVNKGAATMKEVLRITGAMQVCHCKTMHPLGKCCDKIIQEAMDIGFARKTKIEN